jgi:hypothetical protein
MVILALMLWGPGELEPFSVNLDLEEEVRGISLR